LDGYKEQSDGRQEGKGNKGQDQFGPQLCAHDASSSFEEEFHNVPGRKKEKEEEQNHIDVNEGENEDAVKNRDIQTEAEAPEKEVSGQGCDDQEEQGDDDGFPASPFQI